MVNYKKGTHPTCGYYYDDETDLYYLQSRYYDPAIGRFINADSLVFIGQCVLGNNMFAYCLNNPANGCDPCGTCFHRWDFWNDCEKCGGKTIGDKWNGIAQWCEDAYNYVTNTDESVVLSTQKVSFYRGAMVIRADIGSRGGGASFGIILLDDFYTYDETGIADLKHEYGHFVHMRQIGIPSYILTTAIPSGIGAIIADQKGTGIRKFVSDHYVSQPWERIAEHLGGVTGGTYLPGANTVGSLYWLYTQFVGVVFH